MHPFIRTIVMIVAALALLTGTALAQSTVVTIPYGDWIAAVLPFLGAVLLLGLMILVGYGLRFLPPWAQALASKAILDQVQKYAADAIEWGVQAAQGAVKGQTVSVQVGSEIVAAAVQHAIDTWPKAVIDRLGGAAGIKNEIIKRLEESNVILPSTSTAEDILNHPAVASIPERPL